MRKVEGNQNIPQKVAQHPTSETRKTALENAQTPQTPKPLPIEEPGIVAPLPIDEQSVSVIKRLMRLMLDGIGIIGEMGKEQGERAKFLSQMNLVFSKAQLSVPQFSKEYFEKLGLPVPGPEELKEYIRLAQEDIARLKLLGEQESDKMKQLNPALQQSFEAGNQQMDIISALIQQSSTIASLLFR